MNRKSNGKVLLATAGTALLVLAMSAKPSNVQFSDNVNCQQGDVSEKHQTTCVQKLSEQVSWSDWLVGKSTNYQFHFLDLLELLYSDDSSSNDSFNRGPSSQL
ncbi:hypothetical protein [Alteromonas oceanisediminis]|uniref:hypothetical protein n=1 Tax=Alteromonas oceanisediminis TaxID=2836180 RepID=UPI001BD9AF2E|nr:hypothetical protein [Alteromonas oceanisediminis]MBT0586101.1 hypothetical protein [Alteromonas oceanisediminis]